MIYYLGELPPSVNAMYIAHGKHRFKSREYNEWIIKANRQLRSAPKMDCKHFSCDVRLPYSMKTKGDIDNRIKGILDIFVKNKIIEDDRFCLDMRIRYVENTQHNNIEVEFNSMEDCFKKTQ